VTPGSPSPPAPRERSIRAVVVQPAFLGDTVFLGPAVRALKGRWPAGHVALVVTPRGAEVAALIPGVDEVIPYDKRGADRGISGLLRIARRLRAGRFDLALVAHFSPRSGALARLAGIPRRIGYAPLCNERLRRDRSRPFVDLSLELARRAGAPGGRELALGAPAGLERYADGLLAGASRPVVGIVPGAEWPTKRWGAEHYAELLRLLAPAGSTALILGGPGDRDVARQIVGRVGGDVRDTTGNRIAEAISLLARCDLVIGGDTGLVHCARALGRPTVVLFGPTHPERHAFGPRERPVSLGIACQPCHEHGPVRCPLGHFDCFARLDASRVAEVARPLLDLA
jgi:heptosyltransferase-2